MHYGQRTSIAGHEGLMGGKKEDLEDMIIIVFAGLDCSSV